LLTQEGARIVGQNAISVGGVQRRRCKRETIDAPENISTRAMALDLKTRASLVRSIARGRTWLQEITSGKSRDVIAIAQRENLSARSVQMTLSLAFLAPTIVVQAVEGKLSSGLGQRSLSGVPHEWTTQCAQAYRKA
jgi:hypothetical protein